MLKVLMVVLNLRASNGVASFVINYFRKTDHDAIHIDFALYEDIPSPYYEEIKQAGSTIYILPKFKDFGKHVKKCKEILRTGRYDIIHDNTLHITIPMMWYAKRTGIPVRILHSHNSKLGETNVKELRNKAFLPLLRSFATDYTACSALAGKAMFKNQHYELIPNVIDAEKYYFSETARRDIRTEFNAEKKLIIGTVGRLAAQKNPFFALDVFSKLKEQIPNAEYWWIGSGDLDEQVKEYAVSHGLGEIVKFFGSRNDVIDLYQAMDCFFLPSLFEGLPVTGVEAQAMGLPMVVSDTVTDEMVYTDLVDYIGLEKSTDIWVEHLVQALKRKTERESYSEQLKQSIFSDTGCGAGLEHLYRELLQKHGGK